MRSAALYGGEQLSQIRGIDHTHDRFALVLQGDRDRENGQSLTVIGRAVERVDDPQPFAVCIAARAALLAQHGVVGETLRDHAGDERLALAVGARHDIELIGLGPDLEVAAAKPLEVDRPDPAGHLHGKLQQFAFLLLCNHRPVVPICFRRNTCRNRGSSPTRGGTARVRSSRWASGSHPRPVRSR